MTAPGAGQPRTYPQGVTCWVDTEQPDVDAACAFYGDLFGWTFTDLLPPEAPGRYVLAQHEGRDAAAIGSGSGPVTWTTYVAVDDVDATVGRLTGLGASVELPPADAGPGGRRAGLADPQGATFRLWQAKARPGAQALNEPGAWNFSDLHTDDLDAARSFYEAAFGWVFVDQGWSIALQVPGYGDHLEATVDPDIRTRQAHAPEGFADVIGSVISPPNGPPDWHVTFTVADRDESVALAERLGATVLGTEESDWTKVARVRDPQGAELTLSQFTPPAGW